MNDPRCPAHTNEPQRWTCGACGVGLCSACQPVSWLGRVLCRACVSRQERRDALRQRCAALLRPAVTVLTTVTLGAGVVWLGSRAAQMTATAEYRMLERRYAADRPAAPTFTAQDLAGQSHRLADLRGRIVVLDFWASWCGPCRASLPEMTRIAKQFAGGDPVTFLGISVDAESDACQRLIARLKLDWPQIWDGDGGAVASAYKVRALPTMIVIDRAGRIFAAGHLSPRELRRLIRFLLDRPADTAVAT